MSEQYYINRIADMIIAYQKVHKGKKPERIYMSTALYKLIARQEYDENFKHYQMYGVEVKCFKSNELEFSICEVVGKV